jgi:hypothetical protein
VFQGPSPAREHSRLRRKFPNRRKPEFSEVARQPGGEPLRKLLISLVLYSPWEAHSVGDLLDWGAVAFSCHHNAAFISRSDDNNLFSARLYFRTVSLSQGSIYQDPREASGHCKPLEELTVTTAVIGNQFADLFSHYNLGSKHNRARGLLGSREAGDLACKLGFYCVGAEFRFGCRLTAV